MLDDMLAMLCRSFAGQEAVLGLQDISQCSFVLTLVVSRFGLEKSRSQAFVIWECR